MDIDPDVDDTDVPLGYLGRHDVLYESQSSYHSANSFPESLPVEAKPSTELYLLDLDRQAYAAEEGQQQILEDHKVDARPPFRNRLISW